MPNYDGEGLAQKGIVFVSINYRLGNLGLFSYPELTALSKNLARGPFYAAFLNTTNSVLVTAIR